MYLLRQQGNTALMQAAINGRTDMAELLIRAGANVESRNTVGYCPHVMGRNVLICVSRLYMPLIILYSIPVYGSMVSPLYYFLLVWVT
jgi:hypothetical protein